MAARSCVELGSEPERRLSWPGLLLTVAAVTSSLSALLLYQLVVLHAEVEELKSEVCRRRQEVQEGQQRRQIDNGSTKRSSQDTLHRLESEHNSVLMRRKRMTSGREMITSQPCLQVMANSKRKTFNKEYDLEMSTAIPWQTGLRRGSALVEDSDRILIQQEGYYFVYSQVYYTDPEDIMGHVVIRWKASVVGNEMSHVILFRCIKNMMSNDEQNRRDFAHNTCYTGGIAKLEVGDHLELLIPSRPLANISLEGDSTFMGAFKLV